MANLHVEGFYSNAVCGLDSKQLNKWLLYFYKRFYIRFGYLWNRFISIRSFSQAMVLFIAGLNIFRFAFGGKK
jgi:hypothetical protein